MNLAARGTLSVEPSRQLLPMMSARKKTSVWQFVKCRINPQRHGG